VRHEEEVKLAVDDLRLLNKASVNVGTLGRVVDEVLAVVTWRLLEESLTDTLVDNDEGDLWVLLRRRVFVTSILH